MRVALTNFTGGEMAPTLSARYDLARYRNAAQCMENFVPNLHGAAERRMGTVFVAALDGPAVLLPFSFNAEVHQNFVLVLGEKTLRVASAEGGARGLLPGVRLTTPYTVEEAYDLSSAQVGDVVYLAHRSHPLHKLVRRGAAPDYTWELTPVALNTSLRAPAVPVCAFVRNNGKDDGALGYTLRYKVVAVDKNGKESLPSEAGECNGKHPSDWVTGNHVTVTWQAVPGATEYNIYREEAGYFGFVGVMDADGAEGGVVSGLKVGTVDAAMVHWAGSITRTVVQGNGAPDVESQDVTSPLTVAAHSGQNAFLFDGKLLVWVTHTTSITTYTRDGYAADGSQNVWQPSTEVSLHSFWAMVTPPDSAEPAGSYGAYVKGNLGSSAAAPEGAVDMYTVAPVYNGAATLTFTDNNYQADVADTPREDWDPFTDGNHPGLVAFHQQRMVLAATPKTPQAFYMSRVGDFENFRKSRPLQDDDPVEYLVASGSIDAITWAASFGDLLLGTSGSEYKAGGGDGGPITAKNINITAQSYWGSANLAPIIIGNSVMHVQRHGARVRDLFYSLEKDGYAGNDLSIMAPHLFDGHTLRQWAYQQTPGSHIWIVRGDGVLLALTYMKEHDIWGWSRHTTQGDFLSVATVSGGNGDVLMAVVRREVEGRTRYFLERMAPRWSEAAGVEEAFYVDCGVTWKAGESGPAETAHGLDHLEGQSLAVLADGSPVEGCVVRGGCIRLPFAACVVHAGLPYTSALSPMPVEGDTQTGTTLGRKRAYGQCTVRLHASVGGKYGADRYSLYDFPFVPERWGDACELFSGDRDFMPGGGQDTQSGLWLVQDRPLPFTVTGLALVVDVAQH